MSGLKLQLRRLAGSWRVALDPFEDERGRLARVLDDAIFAAAGLETRWVQQVVSSTRAAGTLRGLHAQIPPYTEAKLIVPLSGRMWWVTVDLRRGSPSFGQWEADDLAAGGDPLLVGPGFGHGCISLAPDTVLVITSDRAYAPEHGVGIRHDDPELAIAWPAEGRLLSAAHAAAPSFAEFKRVHGGL